MKKQNRCWGMWRMPLCVAAGLVMGTVVAGASAQPIQAGDHYAADIPTPQEYKGVGDGGPVSGWKYRLHHPDATYIALHFVDFDLGPMDYLVVSDPSGEQTYVLDGQGKMNAGTFWARHIKGDTMDLELIQVDPEGAPGFQIDEYVAGFLDIGDGSKAICGTDDKENAVCYQTSHPEAYQRGRAVARLLSNGSAFCTGWLVSAENHLITNEHCITSASGALNTDYDFGAEAPTCDTSNCANCFPGTVYSGATFIQDNYNLDYCLVQITSGNPAATFGYLEIDNRVATVGEQIYIVGHPGGRAKEMSIYSTDPSDTGGVARVYSITRPACQGSGYNDVGYYADTEGGSSGSPVLAMSSHKVIALHHCANCPNRGVPIHLIYPEIEAYLYPGPAGVVALDRGSYGCADTVEIEMRDGDLGGTVTQTVSVTTSGGDAETVLLQEIDLNRAIFTGSISTDGGPVVAGDGTLQVAHGQTLTVTYIDADDGAGGVNVPVTAPAAVDCLAPAIQNVQTTAVQPRSATVQITANEAVKGTVHYGTTCGTWTGTTPGAGYANPTQVNLTGLQDDTTYYYAVEAEDRAGNTTSADNGGQCYSFSTPEVPDYFTELFAAGNDLDNVTLTFTPNGSVDFYAGCVEPITELPVDPAGGTVLTLSDDSFATVNLTGGTQVHLYGVSYSTFYPGSNGYITFTAGDTARNESLADHFDLPRISALFDDLNPASAGSVSWKQLADRVVVTWLNVPEYNTSNSNTFQIEMHFDGTIVISYLAIAATDGLAGLSAGNGVDPDYYPSDLSGMGPCGPKPPVAQSASYETGMGQEFEIVLSATDDGLPDPPAALDYVITRLPTRGGLRDVLTEQWVTAVPYTLTGGENRVLYRPSWGVSGTDSVRFVANDGGVAPDGGDSNEATVTVVIEAGPPELVYSWPLTINPGWSYTGQWAYGTPKGGGTHNKDPLTGYTGSYVYGYNLYGDYANNLPAHYLTTTAMDLSRVSGAELRFWRWLGVEGFDEASVEASANGQSWTPVWSNAGTTIMDIEWMQMTLDLSQVVDGSGVARVRWGMGPTDEWTTYPGWNIDDIEVWGVLSPAFGDYDGDGGVDGEDFAWLPGCLTGPDAGPVEIGCEAFDFDVDGDVDLGDFAAFQEAMTQ